MNINAICSCISNMYVLNLSSDFCIMFQKETILSESRFMSNISGLLPVCLTKVLEKIK